MSLDQREFGPLCQEKHPLTENLFWVILQKLSLWLTYWGQTDAPGRLDLVLVHLRMELWFCTMMDTRTSRDAAGGCCSLDVLCCVGRAESSSLISKIECCCHPSVMV